VTRAATVALLLALTACAGSTPLVDDVATARVSDDGRSLTVTVLHGVCEEGARRLTVTEAADEVRVRVDGARALSGDCRSLGVLTELTARLDEPLGERVLVDDSDGGPVEVS
jgi:hypothetical protein